MSSDDLSALATANQHTIFRYHNNHYQTKAVFATISLKVRVHLYFILDLFFNLLVEERRF